MLDQQSLAIEASLSMCASSFVDRAISTMVMAATVDSTNVPIMWIHRDGTRLVSFVAVAVEVAVMHAPSCCDYRMVPGWLELTVVSPIHCNHVKKSGPASALSSSPASRPNRKTSSSVHGPFRLVRYTLLPSVEATNPSKDNLPSASLKA